MVSDWAPERSKCAPSAWDSGTRHSVPTTQATPAQGTILLPTGCSLVTRLPEGTCPQPRE